MSIVLSSFFVNNTATSEIYTLSLRDALPIYKGTPTVLTTLHNASGGASVTNGSTLDINSSLYDTAAVTATDGLALTGTVTFQFFPNATRPATANGSATRRASGENSAPAGPLPTKNTS